MARVIFYNAQLSGKLAGTVYSRNKYGFYVKNYTKPNDPRSPAQLISRATLGTVSGAWHALTDTQKSAWNTFGSTVYVPKGGTIAHAASGFTAFVALGVAALMGNSNQRDMTITTPVAATETHTDFLTPTDAPAAAMGSMIQTSGGAPLPLTLGNVQFKEADGELTANLAFGGIQAAAPLFLDSNNSEPVGLVFQISNPVTQQSQFISNPNDKTIAAIGPLDIGGTWVPGPLMTVKFTETDLNIANYKNWFSAGQVAQVTAYLMTETGQMRSIGSKKLTIT